MEQGPELFAQSLFSGGIARIPSADVPWCDGPELRLIISTRDAQVRLEAPGVAPDLDFNAALWAGGQIYAIASALCHRHLGPEWLGEHITPQYPRVHTVEIIYSADLFLGYLPALQKLIQRISSRDPLLEFVAGFVPCWPLSTAGMTKAEGELEESSGEAARLIESHPSLSRMWRDRKMEKDLIQPT